MLWLGPLTVASLCVAAVFGHGKMIIPPARSTLFNTGANSALLNGNMYSVEECGSKHGQQTSDKGQFCGGKGTQEKLGGKCSACGDDYSQSYPRPHDLNGSTIKHTPAVAAYRKGQRFETKVYISAAHKGSFQFRICNKKEDGSNGDVLTECFLNPLDPQRRLLEDADGSGTTNFTVQSAGIYTTSLRLPDDISCPNGCSLQWWYRAGNNWRESDPQEHFVNCADIIIMTCEDFLSGNHAPMYCGVGPSADLQNCANNNNNNGNADNGNGGDDNSGYDNDGNNGYDNDGNNGYDNNGNDGYGNGGNDGYENGGNNGYDNNGNDGYGNGGNNGYDNNGNDEYGNGGNGGNADCDNGGKNGANSGPVNTVASSDEGEAFYSDSMSCEDCDKLFNRDQCSVCCVQKIQYEGIVSSLNTKCSKKCPRKKKFCDEWCERIAVRARVNDQCLFPDFDNWVETCEECEKNHLIDCPNPCCKKRGRKVKKWVDTCKNEDCEDCNRNQVSKCSSTCCGEYRAVDTRATDTWCKATCIAGVCPKGFCSVLWYDTRHPICKRQMETRELTMTDEGDMADAVAESRHVDDEQKVSEDMADRSGPESEDQQLSKDEGENEQLDGLLAKLRALRSELFEKEGYNG